MTVAALREKLENLDHRTQPVLLLSTVPVFEDHHPAKLCSENHRAYGGGASGKELKNLWTVKGCGGRKIYSSVL